MNRVKGFTIVELLVVIVVIGILAAITIVAYTGISGKAVTASLQSDLNNAKKQLSLFFVDHGSYPSGMSDNCPTLTGSAPTPDTRYCLKPSGSNAFTYISSSPYSTFSLSNLNGSTRYSITNNTSPVSGGWIAGIAATALVNKWVYSVDSGTSHLYKNSNTAVASPQGATGLDSNYSSNMSLVSPQTNSGVDFSLYPAQNACKSIGGRLPTTLELQAVYAGRITTYGNNFQAYLYWSATDYLASINYAYLINFVSGGTDYGNKTTDYIVRCVAG